MKPLDPRLLRHASAVRGTLALGAVIALVQTASVIGFSWLLARILVGATEGESLAALSPLILSLLVVVLVRGSSGWLLERTSVAGAVRAKSQLRARVLDAVARRGPAWLSGQNSVRISTIIGSGLDALDPYFGKYLPQLVLTAVGTPLVILMILLQDPASGIAVLVTLPLIPVFMILIGWATRSMQRRQWRTLTVLSTRFLDVVGGLATLTIFGRQRRQVDRIRRVTEEYRAQTMSVLRLSFMSAFVLELAASLSVALVAVAVGIRLIDGEMELAVGLFVLLLVPEAFLPIRAVGAQFHASAEGVAAAEDVFEILEDDGPAAQAWADKPWEHERVREHAAVARDLDLVGVGIRRGNALVVDGLDARFAAGTVSAIVGPSGAGKSTVVAALLGFVPLAEGSILLGGVDVSSPALRARDWLAWAGQRPGLVEGTVAQNIVLGEEEADAGILARALRLAVVDVDPEFELGVGGSGVSGGQAQRISIARAFYRTLARGCSVLVLDEPSSALDTVTEERLAIGLGELARSGVVVVVVSHRELLVATADSVVRLDPRAPAAPAALAAGAEAAHA